MDTLILTLHLLVSVFLIAAILLQAGKGASVGASLGGGGNQPMYGSSQGSAIGKTTAAAAVVFMFTSLALAYISSSGSSSSVMSDVGTPLQMEQQVPMQVPLEAAEPANAE
jgi:preprotein translocase subunit SecG